MASKSCGDCIGLAIGVPCKLKDKVDKCPYQPAAPKLKFNCLNCRTICHVKGKSESRSCYRFRLKKVVDMVSHQPKPEAPILGETVLKLTEYEQMYMIKENRELVLASYRDQDSHTRSVIATKLKELGRIEVTKSGEARFVIPADKMTQLFKELEGEK